MAQIKQVKMPNIMVQVLNVHFLTLQIQKSRANARLLY
ncbi:hypothetical protein F0Z19_3293 [Vibrio cyclitrophicus]|nr:hypothetical protein M565_ctg4P077 [Vibrio cyclitrophicus FF75]KAA8598292.1 hypothetical protein F0Z19_3293 [Vibrio cyclitrophicus]